jgi:hypothetical protein
LRNPFKLLIPCEPVPIDPITIRSLGAVNPLRPNAEAGIMEGKIMVPANAETEFRIKDLRDFSLFIFIQLIQVNISGWLNYKRL